jgi:hypothetical protein
MLFEIRRKIAFSFVVGWIMDETLMLLILSYALARTDRTKRSAMQAIFDRYTIGSNLGETRERIDAVVQRASKVTYNEAGPVLPL